MNKQLQDAIRKVMEDINKALEEYTEWRNHCIRGDIYAGIMILIAYAAWVVWMFT